MPWQMVTPSTDEPLDLGTVKAHCRIDTDADDTLLANVYLPAARDHLEHFTRRQWMTATLRYTLECFPSASGAGQWGRAWTPRLVLPRPPLQSITNVQYYDSSNALTTLASTNYLVDTFTEPGAIELVEGAVWPSTYMRRNAVQIVYKAGWTDPELMPRGLQQALLLLIGHFYENREETVEKALVTIPQGVCVLAGMHRLEEV